MFKKIFAGVIFLHGLIHIIGFNIAFGYDSFYHLAKPILKLAGVCWLIAAFIFMITAVLLLLKKTAWIFTAFAAVPLSQVLLISQGPDVIVGTVLNLIILLVVFFSYEMYNFNRMVNKEAAEMISNIKLNKTIITEDMLKNLPPIVQKWLINTGVVGKEKIQTVRLKQTGEMRTKPGSKWMQFTATEYFTIDTPAFNWQTTVSITPLLSMTGRDKFEKDSSEMLIKLLGWIKVVDAKEDYRMYQATMMRFLAEICWFPSAALADYIHWEQLGATAAKATMQYKGVSVTGIFNFDEKGDMLSFTGDRWYGTGNNLTKEKWFVETNGYSTFNGIRIPGKSEVSWKLNKGDFNWLYLRVMDIEYNKTALYK